MASSRKSRWLIGIGAAIVFMAAAVIGMMIGVVERGYDPIKVLNDEVQGTPIRDTFSGNYLAGHFALSQQDIDKAAEFAVLSLGYLDKEDPELVRSVMRILLMDGRYTEAQFVANALAKKNTADYIARLILLNQAILENEYDVAAVMAAHLEDVSILSLVNDWIQAWIVIGRINKGDIAPESFELPQADESFAPLLPLIYYQQALMLNQLGRVEEAAFAFEKAITLPATPSLRMVRQAILFHNQHANEPSVTGLKDLLNTLEMQAEDELLPKLTDQATQNGESRIITPQEGIAEIYFLLASMHSSPHLAEDMMLYARLGLQLRPSFADLQLMLAAAYEELQDYEAAIQHYDAVEDSSYLDKAARLRVAVNYYSMEQAQPAIMYLQKLAADYPQDREIILALSEIYRREKQFKNMEELLTRWLAESNEEADYDVYYKRAIARERLGRWDDAEKDLNKALELQPGQPDVLNYLGYSLLDHQERIDEAAEFIAQAYEQLPEEAHIIDSMGWAAYWRGDYEAAVRYLESALDKVPQDPTINDHLGDAYWRVGRKREARWQWQRALEFEPEDPHAIEVKIQQGLDEPK